MIRFFANANYDFIGYRRWAYGLTAAFAVPGLVLLLVRGLNYSIEFTGGTLVQIEATAPTPPGVGEIRSALDAGGLRGAEITSFDASVCGAAGSGDPRATRRANSESDIGAILFCSVRLQADLLMRTS